MYLPFGLSRDGQMPSGTGGVRPALFDAYRIGEARCPGSLAPSRHAGPSWVSRSAGVTPTGPGCAKPRSPARAPCRQLPEAYGSCDAAFRRWFGTCRGRSPGRRRRRRASFGRPPGSSPAPLSADSARSRRSRRRSEPSRLAGPAPGEANGPRAATGPDGGPAGGLPLPRDARSDRRPDAVLAARAAAARSARPPSPRRARSTEQGGQGCA
jgi:hypothetical protein